MRPIFLGLAALALFLGSLMMAPLTSEVAGSNCTNSTDSRTPLSRAILALTPRAAPPSCCAISCFPKNRLRSAAKLLQRLRFTFTRAGQKQRDNNGNRADDLSEISQVIEIHVSEALAGEAASIRTPKSEHLVSSIVSS